LAAPIPDRLSVGDWLLGVPADPNAFSLDSKIVSVIKSKDFPMVKSGFGVIYP
jgi:hypothetical protein